MTNHGGKKLFCGAASDFRDGLRAGEIMVGAMTAFAIAVGGVSLIGGALVARLQSRRRGVGRSSRNSYRVDCCGGSDASDGASHSHSTHSDNSASDHSGGSGDGGAEATEAVCRAAMRRARPRRCRHFRFIPVFIEHQFGIT
jgi:hypothetical protein